jgi:hypothetical protein
MTRKSLKIGLGFQLSGSLPNRPKALVSVPSSTENKTKKLQASED